jgi:putative transposase
MPARNVLKPHVANSWYHLYNRGNNKQPIFHDDTDYLFFTKLLKKYLSPEESIDVTTGLLNPMNITSVISLSCFCLMPNHFHLLVKQQEANGITQLTQRILTSFVLYMNNKYKKTGPLFEGKLKGILIDSDAYLLHLSRYIHRNPIHILEKNPLDSYVHSSFPYYIGRRHATWIDTQALLHEFYKPNIHAQQTYKEFVEYENEESDILVNGISLE